VRRNAQEYGSKKKKRWVQCQGGKDKWPAKNRRFEAKKAQQNNFAKKKGLQGRRKSGVKIGWGWGVVRVIQWKKNRPKPKRQEVLNLPPRRNRKGGVGVDPHKTSFEFRARNDEVLGKRVVYNKQTKTPRGLNPSKTKEGSKAPRRKGKAKGVIQEGKKKKLNQRGGAKSIKHMTRYRRKK